MALGITASTTIIVALPFLSSLHQTLLVGSWYGVLIVDRFGFTAEQQPFLLEDTI